MQGFHLIVEAYFRAYAVSETKQLSKHTAEHAAATQMSVSTVKMQVKRNLAKLRSALDVTLSALAATVVLKWLFEVVQSQVHGNFV